jgi:nitrate reductase NapA
LTDLILPSALWVEKNGVFGNSERRTQQWFKMVEPPGEARDDCWQTIAVAHALFQRGLAGMKDRDGRFLFEAKDETGNIVQMW